MESIEKLEEELKIIDEKEEDETRKITDLRIQIDSAEESICDLRNEKVRIKQKITKLKNKNRKKYGVIIIRKNDENIVEEFETLKECYDYIDKMTIKNKVSNIRIDINPERL